MRASKALDELRLRGDEKIGRQIIKRALEEPMRQIINNAGMEGSVVVEKVKQEEGNIGYDVLKEDYVDMIDSGVIDPTKVTRSALENAASISALLVTTEALITDIPEKEKPAAPPTPPGGGMY